MVALAAAVVVDGVIYRAGTDHTAMPAAVVDHIRNPLAWVGGVAPAVSVAPDRPIGPGDLSTAGKARAALGLGSAATRNIGTTAGDVAAGNAADAAGKYVPILGGSEAYLAPSGDAAADAAAINAAILAMSTFGGGRVRLAGQPWSISAALTPRSRVTLAGSPGTAISHTGNSSIIYALAVAFTDFTVEGITFQGSVNEFPAAPRRARTTSSNGAQTAVYMSGDLDTTGTGQAQLTNFTMRNCTVKNCSALPLRIGGVRGRVRVTDCEFVNNQDVGFIFCEEVIFNTNHVYQSADNGVSLSRGCKKITCVGNVIENCAYNGIWVAGFFADKGPTNFTVTGNVVRNVGHNGVYIDYAAKYGVIVGNHIDGGFYRGPSDQATDVNGAGVYLGGYPTDNRVTPTDWTQGIVVSGNQIRQMARAGIYINGVKRVQIIGNEIEDIGTQYLANGTTAIASSDATQNIGILTENATTSSDLTLIGNAVVDSRATPYCNYGVVPQSVTGTNAYWNTMVGCRNASNLYETGPTRTFNMTCVFNFSTRHVSGATVGSNAGSGTISGFDTNGAAGSVRPMRFLTASSERWRIQANGAAESGSNVGSDLEIRAFDDAGSSLVTAAAFTRRGAVTVGAQSQPITLTGRRVSGTASATITVGAQASTATAGSNGANDSSGYISATAVASPAAGTIATVTYATAYTATPKVLVGSRNAATAATNPYVTSESSTGFSIAMTNAPAASASLSFAYHVEG